MPSPRTSRVWFWALVAAALLYVALLSWWSPFTSDTYHHALTGMEHRFSLSLVWERCVASYMNWNPRIGEYLAFAVATAGKWLFILLNPFVQVGLALMMFYLASGRRVDPRSCPDVRLFGLGLLLLFTCTARPGVTIYWLSGATNYSWGAAVWLGFLCLYRGLLENGEKGKPAKKGFGQWAAVLVLGFLAGMTNENNIPGTWLLLGALFVFVRLVRKEKLPLWFYAGVAAQVAGSLCMLLAPGVSARMHSATPGCAEPLSGIWDRWEAVPALLLRMHEYLALSLLLGAVAAWMLWRSFRRNRNAFRPWKIFIGIAGAYILTAYAMALSFVVAVVPADHAMFSATLLFGIGVLALLRVWYGIPAAEPRPRMTVAVFLALSGICVLSTLHDHLLLFRQHEQRVRLILEQKKAGFREIVVPPLVPPSPWCSFIFWVDLSQTPEDYVNRGAAVYYGVHSIHLL
ncbi:DUF6056 family protein [Akkermansia sp.]|uniref:DUF6056 family protein n=1 Tax=Akkermansia sp. TaxID=1872421 RepID=UPI0025C5F5CA|nr:DUF6056 family protein [Akkermansia sp.]MCD8063186.1 DUF6056 family protein [Akkermansia sp.]